MQLIKIVRWLSAEDLQGKGSFRLLGLFLPALILESVFSSGYWKLVSSVTSDIKATHTNAKNVVNNVSAFIDLSKKTSVVREPDKFGNSYTGACCSGNLPYNHNHHCLATFGCNCIAVRCIGMFFANFPFKIAIWVSAPKWMVGCLLTYVPLISKISFYNDVLNIYSDSSQICWTFPCYTSADRAQNASCRSIYCTLPPFLHLS